MAASLPYGPTCCEAAECTECAASPAATALLVFHPSAGLLPGIRWHDAPAIFPPSPCCPRSWSFLCILFFICCQRQGCTVDTRGFFAWLRAGRASCKVRESCGLPLGETPRHLQLKGGTRLNIVSYLRTQLGKSEQDWVKVLEGIYRAPTENHYRYPIACDLNEGLNKMRENMKAPPCKVLPQESSMEWTQRSHCSNEPKAITRMFHWLPSNAGRNPHPFNTSGTGAVQMVTRTGNTVHLLGSRQEPNPKHIPQGLPIWSIFTAIPDCSYPTFNTHTFTAPLIIFAPHQWSLHPHQPTQKGMLWLSTVCL